MSQNILLYVNRLQHVSLEILRRNTETAIDINTLKSLLSPMCVDSIIDISSFCDFIYHYGNAVYCYFTMRLWSASDMRPGGMYEALKYFFVNPRGSGWAFRYLYLSADGMRILKKGRRVHASIGSCLASASGAKLKLDLKLSLIHI